MSEIGREILSSGGSSYEVREEGEEVEEVEGLRRHQIQPWERVIITLVATRRHRRWGVHWDLFRLRFSCSGAACRRSHQLPKLVACLLSFRPM